MKDSSNIRPLILWLLPIFSGKTQLINIINKKLVENIGMLCDLGHFFFLVYKLAKTPILILWNCDMDSPGGLMYYKSSYKRG